ncbi:DUF4192 domain-containing protein [Cumulibacter manganitolerans]|uniref:DUF4192 domain-containing protein n=1 Tax=Cumulibacter manganitolerans TaxID=1884992 RepID=UPI001885F784|nr:DUF4192 domain-containing protein [Cumulibacter manganitolerans]
MTASEPFEPRIVRGEPPEPEPGAGTISIKEVGELRASIPYLLGFYPERSLVLIGLAFDNTVSVTIRVDAPQSVRDAEAIVEQVAPVLLRTPPHRVLVAYCDDYELDEPDPDAREQAILSALRCYETVHDLAPVLHRALSRHGLETGFVWPARPGMPRRPSGPVPAIAVAHAVAGRVLLRSRAELREQLRPLRGSARRAVREQLAGLERLPLSRIDLIAMVTAVLERHAETAAAGGTPSPPDAHEIALCARALADVTARDILITLIAQERAWWRVELWQRVVQLAPTAHVPAAATITAIVAYLLGDGALAQCALDAALARDPGYSLAGMLSCSLQGGLHPRDLRDVLASTFDEEPGADGEEWPAPY